MDLDRNFLLAAGLAALAAYLMGSINFAVLVSRIYAKDDVRRHGSGNAGMTNMLRTYGAGPAFFTGVGDFSKGALAVLVGRMIFQQLGVTAMDGGFVGAAFVLLGHLYPIFFHFKGGKGVLTSCGVILLLNPIVFCILIGLYVPLAFITRIVSLASILGAITFPFATYFVLRFQGRPYVFDTVFACRPRPRWWCICTGPTSNGCSTARKRGLGRKNNWQDWRSSSRRAPAKTTLLEVAIWHG